MSEPLTPLSGEFEKLKSALGFITPPGYSELSRVHIDSNDTDFNTMLHSYVDTYLATQELPQNDLSDVYPFRGILVSVAQIYYERQSLRKTCSASDRAHNYQYKEYLRTVDEDMRFLKEPPNEHMDHLLLGVGVRLENFPDPKLVRFNTNIMQVLGKIDPNISALYKSTK